MAVDFFHIEGPQFCPVAYQAFTDLRTARAMVDLAFQRSLTAGTPALSLRDQLARLDSVLWALEVYIREQVLAFRVDEGLNDER